MHKTYKQKLFFLVTLLLTSPHAAHTSMGTLPNRCFHKKPIPHLKHSPRSYFVAHYRVSSYLALQKSQKTTSLFAQSRTTIFPWVSLSYPIKKQTSYISYIPFTKIRPTHPFLTSPAAHYLPQLLQRQAIIRTYCTSQEKEEKDNSLASESSLAHKGTPDKMMKYINFLTYPFRKLSFIKSLAEYWKTIKEGENIGKKGEQERKTSKAAHEQAKEMEKLKQTNLQQTISTTVKAQKEVIDHQTAAQQQQYDQEAHRNDEDTLKSNLPSYDHHAFVARPELLANLQEYFTAKNGSRTNQYVTLHGWIGSGKTSLALHYGHTYERKRYVMVWWIDATDPQKIEESLKNICVQLGGQNARTDKSMEEIHKELRIQMSKMSNKADTRWLVIWDNVNTNSLEAFEKNNSPENYPSVGGDILITTRDFTLSRGNSLFVDALSKDEAKKLCCQYRKPITEKEKAALEKLIDITKGLPLALAEAGTYTKKKASKFNDYLTSRQEMPIELSKALEKVAHYSQKAHLQKEVKASLDQATKKAPEATRLMHLLAYYDYTHLSKEILLQAIIPDKISCDQTIGALQEQGLLYHRNPETDYLETHPVYQYLLRSQAHHHSGYLQEAATILHKRWESAPNHRALLTSHVNACARPLTEVIHNIAHAPANTYAGSTSDKPELLTIAHQGLGLFYQTQQQYTKAVTHLYTAWKQATHCWGEKAPDTVILWDSFFSAQKALLKKELHRLPDKNVQQVLMHCIDDAQQSVSPSAAASNSIQILCRAGHKDFNNQDLTNLDLRKLNLQGINFANSKLPQDLSSTKLASANLSNTDLSSVKLPQNLSGINFTDAKLPKDLSEHNLTFANLSNTDLANVKLPQNLSGINFTDAKLTQNLYLFNFTGAKPPKDLSKHDLTFANLSHANLSSVKLPQNLSGINFTDAKLPKDLSKHNLTFANLGNTDLTNVTLPQNLSGINFTDAKFPKDLSKHNLTDANLSHTDLSNIKLPRNLSGINFTDAKLPQDLSAIDFTGAKLPKDLAKHNLTFANLSNTDLSNVTLPQKLCWINFTNAKLPKDLSEHNLKGANLSNTDITNVKLPENL